MAQTQMIPIGKPEKARTLEKTRQRNIMKYLNAVPNCKAEIRTQTGYGIKGGADIFGCIAGRHFELEVKQPKKKLTQVQALCLESWEKYGAIVGRVEDVDSTRQLFKAYGVQI